MSLGFKFCKVFDVCLFPPLPHTSTYALMLTDKAGGKKFSKDFEEGSAQLQDFVKFLDRESKGMSPVLEAITNADIFYETQYKEVKIVANVSDWWIVSELFVLVFAVVHIFTVFKLHEITQSKTNQIQSRNI